MDGIEQGYSGERAGRHALLRYGQERGLFGKSGTQKCCRVGRPDLRPAIQLAHVNGERRARWGGVLRCRSKSRCPFCTPHEQVAHAQEINRVAVGHWGGEVGQPDGRGCYLVTLTIPHTQAQGLHELLGWLLSAWSRFTSGEDAALSREAWTRYGVEVSGWVVGFEVTRGSNGWHPHAHILVWTDKYIEGTLFENPEGDAVLRRRDDIIRRGDGDVGAPVLRWASDLIDLWAIAVRAECPNNSWKDSISYDAQDVRSVVSLRGVSSYLAKIGFEIGAGSRKEARVEGSFTPFELLGESSNSWHGGEYDKASRFAALFAEYFSAVEGKHLLRWSRKGQDLRELYQDVEAPPLVAQPGHAGAVEDAAATWETLADVPHWTYATLVRATVYTPEEERELERWREVEWATVALAATMEPATMADRTPLEELLEGVVELSARVSPDAETPPLEELEALVRASRGRVETSPAEALARARDVVGRVRRPRGRRGDQFLLEQAEKNPDLVAEWCAWLAFVSDRFKLATLQPGVDSLRPWDRTVARCLSGLAAGLDPYSV